VIDLKDRNRLFWILQTSGWFFFFSSLLFYYVIRGHYSPFLVAHYASSMAAVFLATLLLRWIYKKLRIPDQRIVPLALLAVTLSLATASLLALIDAFKMPVMRGLELNAGAVLTAFMRNIAWWLIPIGGWSALYVGFIFWQEWTVQKERTEKALALAQAAHLQMIKYRLSPHFLFNSLNSIRALIAEDKRAAKTMVTELSEFLRYSLVSKNYKDVPLKEEIDSLRHYFNIQKMRYEKKLEVAFHIDTAAEDFPVASFLLHPLAENALKFGLRTSPLPLKIRITAGFSQGRLKIEIVNSGSWVEPEISSKGLKVGQGLENVRQRLQDTYPGSHRLDVFEHEGNVHALLVLEKERRRQAP